MALGEVGGQQRAEVLWSKLVWGMAGLGWATRRVTASPWAGGGTRTHANTQCRLHVHACTLARVYIPVIQALKHVTLLDMGPPIAQIPPVRGDLSQHPHFHRGSIA